MRIRRSLAVLAAAAGAVLALAAPATAAPAPTAAAPAGDAVTVRLPVDRSTSFTNTRVAPYFFHTERGSWAVDVYWGFDYNPASNHLAAYTLMVASDTRTNLQADHLRLGDRNGVLKDNTVNAKGGLLEADSAVVACHKPSGVYISRVYYSIRWPDGVLTPGLSTDQLERTASVVCV